MSYGEQFMQCPSCGATAECEAVDVGVGLYLRGDYSCSSCDWEIYGPNDHGFLTMAERPSAPVEAYDPALTERSTCDSQPL